MSAHSAPADPLPVLLVDDNPINQLVAREMLLTLGVAVETADDGADAIDKLAQHRYALVFMDVMMPVLDGLEATRRWRQRERDEGRARVPIVALTANAMAGDNERCLQAGMDDYLPKPVRREQLAQMLQRWGAPPPAAGG